MATEYLGLPAPPSIEDGLVWWLDDSKHPYKHLTFPEDDPHAWGDEYVLRHDDGQDWLMAKSRYGRARTRMVRYSMGGAVQRMGYTREQYLLIRWALWRMDRGWSCREVWVVLLLHGWGLVPGQTPLVSRTVAQWRTMRAKMKREGLQWP